MERRITEHEEKTTKHADEAYDTGREELLNMKRKPMLYKINSTLQHMKRKPSVHKEEMLSI